MKTAMLKAYCKVRAAWVTSREEGQGLPEYLGLVVIVASALSLAGGTVEDGALVQFVQDSVKSAFQTALDKLGIGGDDGGFLPGIF